MPCFNLSYLNILFETLKVTGSKNKFAVALYNMMLILRYNLIIYQPQAVVIQNGMHNSYLLAVKDKNYTKTGCNTFIHREIKILLTVKAKNILKLLMDGFTSMYQKPKILQPCLLWAFLPFCHRLTSASIHSFITDFKWCQKAVVDSKHQKKSVIFQWKKDVRGGADVLYVPVPEVHSLPELPSCPQEH